MPSFLRAFWLLCINAVPLYGLVFDEWSSGTALALYWAENVLLSLLLGVRIALHRRWTRKAGHDYRTVYPSSGRTGGPGWRIRRTGAFLRDFLLIALSFCAVHGVFLGAFIGFGLIAVDRASLQEGLLWVTGLLLAALSADLFQLRKERFAELKKQVDFATSRVLMIHMTLLIGFFAIAWTGRPASLLAWFSGFKLMAELSGVLPQWKPDEIPGWLARIVNRAAGGKGDFAEDYRRQRAAERKRAEEDELPAGV